MRGHVGGAGLVGDLARVLGGGRHAGDNELHARGEQVLLVLQPRVGVDLDAVLQGST